ncbi:MAG: molybdenum cofactor biosynthesis protein MoaE [Planctomycetota bacterium]|nr:MAG: molybdenum cofactor biosynthesis protein MoaE [Planctomycetota bacterium]
MAAAAPFQCRLLAGPASGEWARQAVAGPDAGAVVLFLGTVRAHARGRAVLRLEYEAYPRMVEAELERIAAEVLQRHAVLRVAVEHATGVVHVGATSVAVAVAAAHRGPAFAAAAEVMEQLKQRVPIWKKEFYPDGSCWIGQGS